MLMCWGGEGTFISSFSFCKLAQYRSLVYSKKISDFTKALLAKLSLVPKFSTYSSNLSPKIFLVKLKEKITDNMDFTKKVEQLSN